MEDLIFRLIFCLWRASSKTLSIVTLEGWRFRRWEKNHPSLEALQARERRLQELHSLNEIDIEAIKERWPLGTPPTVELTSRLVRRGNISKELLKLRQAIERKRSWQRLV